MKKLLQDTDLHVRPLSEEERAVIRKRYQEGLKERRKRLQDVLYSKSKIIKT